MCIHQLWTDTRVHLREGGPISKLPKKCYACKPTNVSPAYHFGPPLNETTNLAIPIQNTARVVWNRKGNSTEWEWSPLALFPSILYLQFLITWSMQKGRKRSGVSYHMICGTDDVTNSRCDSLSTFLSTATMYREVRESKHVPDERYM